MAPAMPHNPDDRGRPVPPLDPKRADDAGSVRIRLALDTLTLRHPTRWHSAASFPASYQVTIIAAFAVAGWVAQFGASTGFYGALSLYAALALIVWLTYRARRRSVAPDLAAAAVRRGLCGSCGYSLQHLQAEPDGCIICPECAAAWKHARIIEPYWLPRPTPPDRLGQLGFVTEHFLVIHQVDPDSPPSPAAAAAAGRRLGSWTACDCGYAMGSRPLDANARARCPECGLTWEGALAPRPAPIAATNPPPEPFHAKAANAPPRHVQDDRGVTWELHDWKTHRFPARGAPDLDAWLIRRLDHLRREVGGRRLIRRIAIGGLAVIALTSAGGTIHWLIFHDSYQIGSTTSRMSSLIAAVAGIVVAQWAWRNRVDAAQEGLAFLEAARCPACAADLRAAPTPDPDGCKLCPTCTAAWRPTRERPEAKQEARL